MLLGTRQPRQQLAATMFGPDSFLFELSILRFAATTERLHGCPHAALL